MFPALKDSTKTIVFTVLVLLLATGFSYIPGMFGFVYMMTPTISVLLMMLVVTRDGYTKAGWRRLGLHKLGRKQWPFVLLVPIVPLALGFGVVLLLGLADLQIGETFQGFSWASVPLILIVLYVRTVLMESLGEELGWRGYLLPVMLGCMGKKKALLLNGFIHGVWHFPIILNTDAYHADQSLWLLLPLTVLTTTCLAPVIGEIRIRSDSVWTSSMMHTTHNLVWVVMGALIVNRSEAAKYIAGDLSLVVVLFYLALTLFLWYGGRSATIGSRRAET